MIDSRLKQERERLGLAQPAFADAANAAKRTLIDWEKGVSSPTAVQLGALSKIGVDVLYVVTGRRSQDLPPAATLPPDQQVLVSAYERCTAAGKQHLIQTAALLSAGLSVGPVAASPKRATPKPKPAPNSVQVGNMTNHASGGVQVGYAGGKVTSKVITQVKKPKE